MSWFRKNILSDHRDECQRNLDDYKNGRISESEYVRSIDSIRSAARQILEGNENLDPAERKIIERDLSSQEHSVLWQKVDEV